MPSASAAAAAALERVVSAEPFLRPGTGSGALCEMPPPFGLRDPRLAKAAQTGRHKPAGAWLGESDCEAMARRLSGRCVPAWGSGAQGTRFRTCAVVGSGGGLRGSGLGREIDAHELVVRLNGAPTVGPISRDVGGRTTLRIATHSPYRQWRRGSSARARRGGSAAARRAASRSALGASLAVYCHNAWVGSCHSDLLGANRSGGARPASSSLDSSPHEPHIAIHPGLVGRAAALLSAAAATADTRAHARALTAQRSLAPSSGAVAIAVALASCAHTARIDVYGFGESSPRPSANATAEAAQCDHYWECRTDQRAYFGGAGHTGPRAHDWSAQSNALTWLEAVGAVRLHARRGGLALPAGRMRRLPT